MDDSDENVFALRLLLIEDTPSDARIFCEQVKERHGDQAIVVWKRSFKDAMLYLKSAPDIDQIWLDPGLGDLSKEKLGAAIAYLKQYGQVQLLSSMAAPSIKREATRQEVEVYEKTTDLESVLAKITEVLQQRSGGSTTVRVGQAQLEGKIAKLEYQVGENVKSIERSHQELLKAFQGLQSQFAEVKQVQEADSNDTAYKLAKMQVMSQIVVAIATGLFGLLGISAPILIPLIKEFYFQKTQAPVQSPPQPERSPR